MSLNATLLINPLVDFITGKIIEAGAVGDPVKLTTRAKELIAINTALTKLNSGDPAGVTELQSALNTTGLTPGEALAIQSLFATVASQISVVASVAGGTLFGAAGTAILNSILNTANTVATAYIAQNAAVNASVTHS